MSKQIREHRPSVIMTLSLCFAAIGPAKALAVPPTIESTTVTDVTGESATLRAVVNPNSKPGSFHFEYDTIRYRVSEGPHGTSTTNETLEEGTKGLALEAKITGLSPEATYHFRVVAENVDGPVNGPDRLFTTTSSTSPFPPCPNEVFRTGNLAPIDKPSAALPDCRAYEQASPVKKNGLDTVGTYPTTKASPSGDAITFAATSGVPGGDGAQEPPLYLSMRKGESWSTQGLLPPAVFGAFGFVRGWTPDFAHVFTWAQLPGEPETSTFLDRASTGGSVTQIYPHLPGPNPAYVGASPDGSQVFFETFNIPLAEGAAAPARNNLYVWERASKQITLVGVLPDSECKPPPCAPPGGAFAGPYDWVNGPLAATGGGGLSQYYLQEQNAVSKDAKSVYFTAGGGQIYLRKNPLGPEPETDHVSASEKKDGKGPEGTDAAGTRPAAFMAATPDGSEAFFTSSEKLTDDATTGLEPSKPAAIARANLLDGKEANFSFLPAHAKGIAISGSHVYWADPSTNTIGRAKLGASKGEEVEEAFIVVPKVTVEGKAGPESVPAKPQYVTIDPTAEHIYWTNAPDEVPGHGSIGTAELTPTGPKAINAEYIKGKEEGGEEKPLITNPQGIAVNSEFIYWANAGKEDATRTIGQAKPGATKGEEVKGTFIAVGNGGFEHTPQGIAINATHIYTAVNSNQEQSYVLRFDLSGEKSSEKLLFDSKHVGKPGVGGIALDAGHVYWAREGEDAIGRAPLDLKYASEKEREEELSWIKEADEPRGLALDATHIYWSANQDVLANQGNDLYRYEAKTGKLTDLTVDTTNPNGIGVRGVLGVSADGSRIYFVANGVPGELVGSPNEEGESAAPGDCKEILGLESGGVCNLYLWHDDTISFIARIEDEANWTGTPAGVNASSVLFQKTARLSADGETLLFSSRRALTANENEKGTTQLYRYRAGDGLLCVSCRPSGEAPVGIATARITNPVMLPEDPASTLSRTLSADGGRVFFESTDALVSEDTNGTGGCPEVGSELQRFPACQDVYEWEAKGTGSCKSEAQNGGCLYLISSGKSPFPSFFLDASVDGDEAFIITRSSLVRQDMDEVMDIYAAKVDGGLEGQNRAPEVCGSTPDCRPAGPEPSFKGPVSEGPGGGNVKEKAKRCRKPKRLIKVKGKSRCVAKKGNKRKGKGKGKSKGRQGKASEASGKADESQGVHARPVLPRSPASPRPAVIGPSFDPKPAWRLTVTPLPTNFAPGEKARLFVVATNVGAEATGADPVELEVELPEGVVAVPKGATGTVSDPDFKGSFDCTVASPTVSCEAKGQIHPSRWLRVTIVVEALPGPDTTLEGQASIGGGGAEEVADISVPIPISPAIPDFGFIEGPSGLGALLTNADGSATSLAGSHPDQLTAHFGFPVEVSKDEALTSAGHLHELQIELPRGLVVNPAATPVLCTEAELESEGLPGCPRDSQVGTVNVMTINGLGGPPLLKATPDNLYNMVPPAGSAGALGFDAVGSGIHVHVIGSVRSDGDYGITGAVGDILAFPNTPVLGGQSQIWGNPTGKSHDQVRDLKCSEKGGSCPAEEPLSTAAITMPSQCGGPMPISAKADKWEEIGSFDSRGIETADVGGTPVGVSGCNKLDFSPKVSAQPSTNAADSPAGLEFNLHQPQEVELEGLSTASLKDATVTLPEGLVVNPAAAGGQGVCTTQEIGLATAVGAMPIHFDKVPATCPNSARLGSFEATTPLLAQIDPDTHKIRRDPEGHALPRAVEGSVYLAEPFKNPFESLLAIYFAVNDERSGTVAKFATEVQANPLTGQLTNVLTEGPQLPLEDVRIKTFPGARASLRTPATCGDHTTTTDLIPWSSPEGANANPSDSFAVISTPGGGACPTAPGTEPNQPLFKAGTLSQKAGAYSPFAMRLSREDGSQQIGGLEVRLPKGLLAKIAGIPYCSEAQIALARSRSNPNEGRVEQASPSCPAVSRIGTIDSAAGSGPAQTLVHVPGEVYLAGPYKGAPISFVTIVPAVSGPFDLGTVVVRAAAYVDPEAATARAVTDPLPSILYGIPLDLRVASLSVDRDQFILNPTNCESKTIGATTTSLFGQPASLSAPFGVGNCADLKYKPKLTLKLKGQSKRTGHPALTATGSFTAGQANTDRAAVTLPRSEFLDQAHIGTVCTRVQFAAEKCPAASIYGHAMAITPLLDEPVEGPVYLRSSNHELPDIVFDLHGQVDAVVSARVDSVNGGIRATIENAPDAPVTKFVVKMRGGKKGLLINSVNLCKLEPRDTRATAKLRAQNGRRADLKPVVKSDCRGKGKAGKGPPKGKGKG